MRRSLSAIASCVLGAACGAREPAVTSPHAAAPSASVATSAAPPPAPPAPEAIAVDAPIEWAFFREDGALVAVSKDALFLVDASPRLAPKERASTRCLASRRVPASIAFVEAKNGAPRFVVTGADRKMTIWDAEKLAPVVPIDHPTPERGAEIARDGARVAALGCAEIKDPSYATSCGELYDGATGRHVASFVAPHPFGEVAFEGGGRYLVGRGDVGLTVWDAATGKALVTRRDWHKLLEIHAWNGPDLAEIVEQKLVVGHGASVEVVDLTTGKTLASLARPGKTMAAFAPRSGHVALLEGASGVVHLWDAWKGGPARRVDLKAFVAKGANCTHCTVEFDEADEDRLRLVSTYTPDRLLIHFASGQIERAEGSGRRDLNVASPTHRLSEAYDVSARAHTCALVRRDRDEPPRPIPMELCNRTYGPSWREEWRWPYPGFAPSGARLASVYEHELQLFDLTKLEPVCTLGQRDAPRQEKPRGKKR
ncbi:MAG: WD40 repeat domain-containing protein [Polyangiaceae bacterium]